ncbi:hypothetical protein [Sphingopyxis yananensis]|uniref:hypothetical protein n=1 Tax=Sphingopyxis yananensis TaxID=2886687 RepID=UPI001D10ADD1|nr:hypothetical protein [Sphingopyxis yananensis]MCC2601721.1 hypothetical protein [Sphingopyxis yananensis]
MTGKRQVQRRRPRAPSLWTAFRRAAFLPWCAAFLVFVTFFYLPETWLASTAWQLYLDRLHPLFTMPASLSARAWMGGAAALIVFLLLTLVMLLLPRGRPRLLLVSHADAKSIWALSIVDQRLLDDMIADQGSAETGPDAAEEPSETPHPNADVPTPRNRWDRHPDDSPRAPISAERELPAGGLDGVRTHDAADPDVMDAPDTDTPRDSSARAAALSAEHIGGEALVSDDRLADNAHQHRASEEKQAPEQPEQPEPPAQNPAAQGGEADPWLQSVHQDGPAAPAADDVSLSALVARLEARLARRRRPIAPVMAQAAPMPAPDPAPMTVADHQVDLALEAALGTLQRMNLRAVG